MFNHRLVTGGVGEIAADPSSVCHVPEKFPITSNKSVSQIRFDEGFDRSSVCGFGETPGFDRALFDTENRRAFIDSISSCDGRSLVEAQTDEAGFVRVLGGDLLEERCFGGAFVTTTLEHHEDRSPGEGEGSELAVEGAVVSQDGCRALGGAAD